MGVSLAEGIRPALSSYEDCKIALVEPDPDDVPWFTRFNDFKTVPKLMKYARLINCAAATGIIIDLVVRAVIMFIFGRNSDGGMNVIMVCAGLMGISTVLTMYYSRNKTAHVGPICRCVTLGLSAIYLTIYTWETVEKFDHELREGKEEVASFAINVFSFINLAVFLISIVMFLAWMICGDNHQMNEVVVPDIEAMTPELRDGLEKSIAACKAHEEEMEKRRPKQATRTRMIRSQTISFGIGFGPFSLFRMFL